MTFAARSWAVGERTLVVSHIPDRVQVALMEQEATGPAATRYTVLAWFPSEDKAALFAELMDAGVARPGYADGTFAAGTYGG